MFYIDTCMTNDISFADCFYVENFVYVTRYVHDVLEISQHFENKLNELWKHLKIKLMNTYLYNVKKNVSKI